MLVDKLHERRHEAGARDLQRLLVDLQQQVELRLQRHLEGVLLDRRVPARVEAFDGREADRLLVDRAVGLGDADGLGRDARDLVLAHHAAAGKAPGAVDDQADAETMVVRVGDVLHTAVPGEDELIAVAVDADVRVRRAELLGGGQRGVGEVAELGRALPEQHLRRGRRGRSEHDHGLDELATVDHRGILTGDHVRLKCIWRHIVPQLGRCRSQACCARAPCVRAGR